MKLYFSPGACCMSCHIALEISQLPFELVYVGKHADAAVREAFLKVNPLGAVPALALSDQRILTQNIAILEYIADQKPESKLLAPAGTFERAETMMWLSLIATDLHKSFAPLFRMEHISSQPQTQQEVKDWCYKNINKYLHRLEERLQNKAYLMGDHITIADCYLYTVYQWCHHVKLPTDQYPALNRYSAMIDKLPSVVKVHDREKAAA